MTPEAELLKEVPLFQLLDDQEREQLAAKLTRVSYAAGATIFTLGDPGEDLYIVSCGEVEMYFKNDTGERIVLEVAHRGDFFGDLSLLDQAGRSASTCAVEDTEVLRLERRNLEQFLVQHPQASMDLLAAMGRRLRKTVEKLRHTASRNVNEEMEDHRTIVQKSADWIAEFSGSIPFLLMHVVFFVVWLTVNWIKIPGIPQFDPYPFGFLTLSVSLEAIFLSVFVLLSQNRQAAKDRVRSDIEYDVNLKAELEIAHLHEKMDRLTCDVLLRLDELSRRVPSAAAPASSASVDRPDLQPVVL